MPARLFGSGVKLVFGGGEALSVRQTQDRLSDRGDTGVIGIVSRESSRIVGCPLKSL